MIDYNNEKGKNHRKEEKNMFRIKKAEWIWAQNAEGKDIYADFIASFEGVKDKKTTLYVSADSDYTAYLNGKLLAFTQYPDYPNDKVGDVIDLTPYLCDGVNHLSFTVWSYGEGNQSYIPSAAGLLFEVRSQNRVLTHSSPDTLSRRSPAYVAGECKKLTGQMGLSFHYDFCGEDGFHQTYTGAGFAKSIAVPSLSKDIRERPIKRLTLGDTVVGTVVHQGCFYDVQHTSDLGKDMQCAALSQRELWSIGGRVERELLDGLTLSCPDGDGIYCILDLGEEQVGFLDVDFAVDVPCRVEVAWGEHLNDGRCRTGVRNLTCVLDAAKGRNQYLNSLRRLGCRYLQFFFRTDKVTLYRAGIRPVSYPLRYKKYKSGNLLRDTIYYVSQRTLDACMHVHYEDCPWREQALYTMDSRNQMLCGYYAFGETAFPRACLDLMANGMREDGILTLCFPSEQNYLTIPSFSLVWMLQNKEYIDYTKDLSLAQKHYPTMCRILDTFRARKNKNGLIDNPQGKQMWNFYEWSDTMDGSYQKPTHVCDAPLNAFYSIALQSLSTICTYLGMDADAKAYAEEAEQINRALASYFYDADAGLFRTADEVTRFSVLTNSLCLYCGAAKEIDLKDSKILAVLSVNGAADTGLDVVSDTLSMVGFRYDALLATDKRKYKSVVLSEIDRVYLGMLRGGATTFWETVLGERDFKNAGSLCHGWSALPIYYYETLL